MENTQNYRELIELLLPEGLLEYFELSNTAKGSSGLVISLEEKNIHPQEYKAEQIESKGFYPETLIQDFPIRRHKVFLCIKRRRWEIKSTGQIVSRDWHLVQSGTRMTKDFADFLKGVFG